MTILKKAALILISVFCVTLASAQDAEWPQRTIRVIVPFNAGGGSDTLVRVLQKSFQDRNVLRGGMAVLNFGGHYSVGCRKAISEAPDGYNFLVMHRAMMGGKATGVIDFDHEDFEPVAEASSFSLVLAVGRDSQWQTLDDLLDDAKKRPGDIVFGCNMGALNHMAGVSIEESRPGAEFNYVQIGSGADNFDQIKGGHVSVSVFGASEYASFKEELRPLAYTGVNRHPSIPEVPTLKELGHDVTFSIGSWWFAPKSTPQHAIDGMADLLEEAMNDPKVQEQLVNRAYEASYFRGEEFKSHLESNWKQVQAIAPKMNVGLGSFVIPSLIIGTTAVLIIMVIGVSLLERRRKRMESEGVAESKDDENTVAFIPRPWLAVGYLAMTAVYTILLELRAGSFAVLTTIFVFLGITVMLQNDKKGLWFALILALIVGFGCEYVFTEIFTLDLPTRGA